MMSGLDSRLSDSEDKRFQKVCQSIVLPFQVWPQGVRLAFVTMDKTPKI